MKATAWALAVACAVSAHAAEFNKILFLGNSITLHGLSQKVDWSGNWGMAASAKDKDYAHLVAKALAMQDGTAPEILVQNISAFERQYATYDAAVLLKDTAPFQADLIVVAVGENVPVLGTDAAKAQFKDGLVKLLNGVKAGRAPTVVVRSCFWANAAKDAALKQACAEVAGVFVDISALCKDEKNFARTERQFKSAGVANHPGDKGMQAIADAIAGAIKEK